MAPRPIRTNDEFYVHTKNVAQTNEDLITFILTANYFAIGELEIENIYN